VKAFELDPSRTAATGARQAALLLHSLAADDREWMLGHVTAGQRAELRELLQELTVLGLQPDRAMLADTLHALDADASGTTQAPAAAASGAAHTADTEWERVRDLPFESVTRVLLAEPDRLIASLLRLGPWPWQAQLFARMTTARQQNLQALLRETTDTPTPGAAMRQALLLGLIEHATNAHATDHGAPSQSRANWSWRHIVHRLTGNRSRKPRT